MGQVVENFVCGDWIGLDWARCSHRVHGDCTFDDLK